MDEFLTGTETNVTPLVASAPPPPRPLRGFCGRLALRGQTNEQTNKQTDVYIAIVA